MLAGAEQRVQTAETEVPPEAWRDLALVELLYDAGLRAGEAWGRREEDVDVVGGWIRVEQ